VPQVVPVQVDAPEFVLAGRRQSRASIRLPLWLGRVRLEHRHYPRGSESAERLSGLIAEDECVSRLLRAFSLELQPFQNGSQPSCGERRPRDSSGSWSSRTLVDLRAVKEFQETVIDVIREGAPDVRPASAGAPESPESSPPQWSFALAR
jgi:hypothetical protein